METEKEPKNKTQSKTNLYSKLYEAYHNKHSTVSKKQNQVDLNNIWADAKNNSNSSENLESHANDLIKKWSMNFKTFKQRSIFDNMPKFSKVNNLNHFFNRFIYIF